MKYQTENFNGRFEFRHGYHKGWTVESHLHEYSEFLYCEEGVGDVFINGIHISLPQNHVIWIPPNYIHQFECENAHVICGIFSNDFIPLIFQTLKDKRMKAYALDASNMKPIFQGLFSASRDNLPLISGYLNLICSEILENAEYENTRQTDGILYQKVIFYLAEHFQENISLKHIAKELGYNEKYLSHNLHELTGIHFSKFLSLYRLEYARKMLLSDPSGSIAKIAQDSGFSALNTFNRVFKEFTGMTPSQYKRTAGQN